MTQPTFAVNQIQYLIAVAPSPDEIAAMEAIIETYLPEVQTALLLPETPPDHIARHLFRLQYFVKRYKLNASAAPHDSGSGKPKRELWTET